MRENEFRAWDKLNKKMISHNELFRVDCSNEYPFLALLKNFYQEDLDVEIMQYTGLKDIDGKEIYEGDIVKCRTYIALMGCLGNLGVEIIKFDEELLRFGTHFNALSELKEIEVVGNIYENPELLKT